MGNYFNERNLNNIATLRQFKKDLPEFISEFFLGIENQTTPLTRLNYAYDVKQFLQYLSIEKFDSVPIKTLSISSLEKVTVTDLENYLEHLSYFKNTDGKVHTNNERAKSRHLSTIRTLFKYFFNKEKLSSNVAAKVKMPKIHDKEIVRLEVNEVADILNLAEGGEGLTQKQLDFHKKTKVRDVALLTLFLGTGIRISECVGLNVDDIDFNVNGFKVTRKGGNSVILYFSDEVAKALRDYLNFRISLNIPKTENALFLSSVNNNIRRISTRAVQNLVGKYAKIVSPLKKITPHKLRSTYGTTLYRETQDIYVVAEVLGHKDVNTTKKHYAAISDDIRREAARKVKLRDD